MSSIYPASLVCCRRLAAHGHSAECLETRKAIDGVLHRVSEAVGLVLLGQMPLQWLEAQLRLAADEVGERV